jgi:hypothetical protein
MIWFGRLAGALPGPASPLFEDCDNTACIEWEKNAMGGRKRADLATATSKHIEIRMPVHYACEAIQLVNARLHR